MAIKLLFQSAIKLIRKLATSLIKKLLIDYSLSQILDLVLTYGFQVLTRYTNFKELNAKMVMLIQCIYFINATLGSKFASETDKDTDDNIVKGITIISESLAAQFNFDLYKPTEKKSLIN